MLDTSKPIEKDIKVGSIIKCRAGHDCFEVVSVPDEPAEPGWSFGWPGLRSIPDGRDPTYEPLPIRCDVCGEEVIT